VQQFEAVDRRGASHQVCVALAARDSDAACSIDAFDTGTIAVGVVVDVVPECTRVPLPPKQNIGLRESNAKACGGAQRGALGAVQQRQDFVNDFRGSQNIKRRTRLALAGRMSCETGDDIIQLMGEVKGPCNRERIIPLLVEEADTLSTTEWLMAALGSASPGYLNKQCLSGLATESEIQDAFC
jgi:hypothetical protein